MEKLTRTKCVFALAGLYSAANGEHNEENKEVLQQLIDEHFSNPPLKFEELHENMWVWDNKEKEYRKIYEVFRFKGYEEWIGFVGGVCRLFEENRFYRREVKNDEDGLR